MGGGSIAHVSRQSAAITPRGAVIAGRHKSALSVGTLL